MAHINMVTATEYKNTGKLRNFVFDCDFGTGSASLDLKSEGATAFKTIKTFSADEVVAVLIPQGAIYKATITGDAELVATFDY